MKLPKPISQNTRVAQAGKAMGEAIVNIVHILYLDRNALQFLSTLCMVLNTEYDRRINKWLKVEPMDVRVFLNERKKDEA